MDWFVLKEENQMKKNRILYGICKGLNWSHWFIILGICTVLSILPGGDMYDLDEYGMIIGISTFLYAIFWFAFQSTRSRILYQMWFFLGYIYAEYCMLFSPTGGLASWIGGNIHASVIQKIILTLACICAFTHKIYTMRYETEDYKAGASRRHNNKLDDKVYYATRKLEHATTFREKQQAEAELERAKYNRERYGLDEDD